MVCWFGAQNQTDYGLSVAPQNQLGDEDSVGHVSRSSSLLHVNVSRARVSQSGLKTGGGATAGGALKTDRGATVGDTRGTIVKVVSSPS
jgi:hypothetical protein